MPESTDAIKNIPASAWTTVNLGSSPGTWQFTDQGILQVSSTVSKKMATGTMLLCTQSHRIPLADVEMKVRTATTFYTGIVFNYRNDKNFNLFTINRGARASSAYWIEVGEVVDGDFRVLCKEKYSIPVPFISVFSVRNVANKVVLLFNEENVFDWDGNQLVELLPYGLYSQQNSDAEFFSLAHSYAVPVPSSTGSENPPATTTPAVPEKPQAEDHEQAVRGFMQLKKPASKTSVQFSETFIVPLDSFYSSLRSFIHEDHDEDSRTLPVVTNIETLDLRPKRWYRQIRTINNFLDTLGHLGGIKKANMEKAKITLAEKVQNNASKDDVKKAELEVVVLTTERQEILSQIEKAQDTRSLLLREVRTNGYSFGPITDNRISSLGFDFEISRPLPGVPVSKGVLLPENFDYNNDVEWNLLEAEVYKELFEGGSVKPMAKELYITNRDQLKSATACVSLQSDINYKKQELDTLKLKSDALKSIVATNTSKIADLVIARQKLATEKNTYVDYKATDYDDRVVGPHNKVGYDQTNKLYGWIASLPKLNPTSDPIWYERVKGVAGGSFMIDFYGLTLFAYKVQRRSAATNAVYSYITDFRSSFMDYKLQQDGDIFFYNRKMTYSQADPSSVNWSLSSIDTSGQASYDIKAFFSVLEEYCNRYSTLYTNHNLVLNADLIKVATDIQLKEKEYEYLITKGLSDRRKAFIAFWNNPYNTKVRSLHFEVIQPDVDPLAEFLVRLDKDKEPLKTYYFSPTENGYTNQHGQSLVDFIENKYLPLESSVSLFPVLESNGGFSEEVIKIVKNPRKSNASPGLPIIKFIETYKITVGWQGYGLGELSHSVNLFPGESKELVVEKKTKLTSKTDESRKTSTEAKENTSSSFEDNLNNTFSEEDKADSKAEDKSKTSSDNSGSNDSTQSSENSATLNWNFEAKADWGWGSAGGGASGANAYKSASTTNNKRAFSMAQNNEGLRASNQSKDILKKNVSNTIKKVANETSINNKVEFTSSSSQEFQSELSNKEIIKLENPNVGRTVNYNFFQVQNLYGTTISLTDVKIVINTGSEIIEQTGINDLRVYELEEFGKVFPNSNEAPHDVLIASIIARQVLKHYGNFLSGSGNGALRLPAGYQLKKETLEILSYTDEPLRKDMTREDLLLKLTSALEDLKAIPFYFQETEVMGETTLTVNAGAYHLEAQVGLIPATEKYLEDRRDVETTLKRAEVDHLKEQTRKSVFYNPLPSTLTHLNYETHPVDEPQK